MNGYKDRLNQISSALHTLSLYLLWESFINDINEMEKRPYKQPENCDENLQVGNAKEVKTQYPEH